MSTYLLIFFLQIIIMCVFTTQAQYPIYHCDGKRIMLCAISKSHKPLPQMKMQKQYYSSHKIHNAKRAHKSSQVKYSDEVDSSSSEEDLKRKGDEQELEKIPIIKKLVLKTPDGIVHGYSDIRDEPAKPVAQKKAKKAKKKKGKKKPKPLPPPPLRLGAKADLYNRFDKAHENVKQLYSIAKGVYTDYIEHNRPFLDFGLTFTQSFGIARSGEAFEHEKKQHQHPVKQKVVQIYRAEAPIFDKSYLKVSRNVYHYVSV